MGFRGPVVMLQGNSLEAAVAKMLQYTKRTIPEDARISHRYLGKERILSLSDMVVGVSYSKAYIPPVAQHRK